MAQVTVDVPSFSLTVEKKQPVQVRTDVSFAQIASHGEDGFLQFANSSALGSHPSLAFNTNTSTTSIQTLKSVDAILGTANITVANIATLYTGSTIVSAGTFEDLSISSGLTVGENITVTGNLTVHGTRTEINSSTLTVDDKNIEMAATDSPSDVFATGGGIILKGDTDKTIIWADSTDSWNFNQDVDIKKVTSADSRLLIDEVQIANSTYITIENLTVDNAFQVGSGTTSITSNDVKTGTINLSTLNTATAYVTTAIETQCAKIFDLTDGRVTYASVMGELVDSSNLTFDGTVLTSAEITTPEANITVSNTVTSYTTSSLVLPVGNDASRVSTQGGIRYSTAQSTFEGYDGSAWGSLGGVIDVDQDTYIKAELSDDNDILDFYTKGTRQAYISNAGLVAVTTKMTVPEANVTVANVSTLYVTSGATVPTPTASTHAATKAYVDSVSATVVGNTIELGAVPDSSWHDGAFLANNVTYDINYLPTEGIEDNDNVTATLDTLNEVMHNVYRSSYVRHAKFTGSGLSGPATLTPTFTIDSEVYNTYDATRYDWDFGDGNTLSNQSATTQQHSYTTNAGSPFTVTLTAKNHNAEVSGSKGSFSTFKWEDMVIVYTNAPIPAFTYAYTQRDSSSVGPTSALNATINVDESSSAGDSQPITYDVTASQFTTHWMLSFSDGTTYPTSATTGQSGATLEANWEVYASTKDYDKTWSSITQDTNFTATLYCYSTTTDPTDPKRNSSGSPHNIRVFRDYTNIGTFTAVGYNSTLTGNNNEDVDNNAVASGASEDGMKVTLTPALSGGSINGSYSTQLQWSFEDAYNSQSTAGWNYTASNFTNVKVVYFARQSNTADNSGDVKTISAQISSSHTLSPFVVKIGGATTTDVTIQKDPRAIWSAVFVTSSADASGGSTTKGYNFTDWDGNVRNSAQFTDASENVNAWNWDFDLDNSGTSTSTTQSPLNSYTTTGQYDIKLIATGANSETHRYASAADDTEQKNNYIEMVALPSYSYTYLTGKSMSVSSQGSYTAKLCSGFTDNSGSETHGLSADDTVNRRSSTTVAATKFSTQAREFVGDAGGYSGSILTALVNGSADGAKTFTTGSDNGTYTSLVVSDDNDIQYGQSAFPTKFNRIYKGTISNASALSAGINCYKLSHNNGASTTTSGVLSFVVDTDMTSTPSLNAYNVAMNSNGTVRYMSKMAYLRNSGTPKLAISSLNITNLAGECFADTTPIQVVDSGGSAVNGTKYMSYSDLSISTPLARNSSPTGLSGNVTITPTGKGIDGTIKLRGVNLNGSGSYVADSTNIMYWNNTPQIDEEDVSDVSGGYSSRNSMIRVGGFSVADTPSYTAADFYSTAAWNSQTTTLVDSDAPLIPHSTADRFVWDNTNWQTKLPGLTNNNDRSSAPASQYVTFAVSKTNVNSLILTLTGKISAMYCAFPGAGDGVNLTDTSSGLNGWLNVGANYGGAGMPGSDTGNGGNGSDGIRNPASPGTAPASFSGSTLSGDTFNISLGTCNTANGSAHNHNILIRVVLASGHYLSAISFST